MRTEQQDEEMASSGTGGGLDWISRKDCIPKELLGVGTGKWCSHHPRAEFKRCLDVALGDVV